MTYFLKSFFNKFNILLNYIKIFIYFFHRKPFVLGYDEYKWFRIKKKINNNKKEINETNVAGIDERIIEYKWIINELSDKRGKLLDAGSTINFKTIIDHLNNFDVTIQTLFPEKNNFSSNSVSYVYSDLKECIFKENCFDYITCISTLEHVGFNNNHYNYFKNKKYEILENDPKSYLDVIKNFKSILKNDGELYLTLPFGKKQIFNHLQQFDSDEIKKLIDTFAPRSHSKYYYIYKNFKWTECEEKDCKEVKFRTLEEKNPVDKAASARSMIFLKLRK